MKRVSYGVRTRYIAVRIANRRHTHHVFLSDGLRKEIVGLEVHE
jgi:hypothetical protein